MPRLRAGAVHGSREWLIAEDAGVAGAAESGPASVAEVVRDSTGAEVGEIDTDADMCFVAFSQPRRGAPQCTERVATGKTLLMSTRRGSTGTDLERSVQAIAAEEALSGVVRLDLDGEIAAEVAFGQSHRSLGIEMTISAQLAIASGNKAFTALVVLSLVEQGDLALDSRVRSILGDDLPLVDDRVTVEHLLAHRSGIGDYLDEDAVDDPDAYLMPVPVHELVNTDDYLPSSTGIRPSSRRASGSHTATAAT